MAFKIAPNDARTVPLQAVTTGPKSTTKRPLGHLGAARKQPRSCPRNAPIEGPKTPAQGRGASPTGASNAAVTEGFSGASTGVRPGLGRVVHPGQLPRSFWQCNACQSRVGSVERGNLVPERTGGDIATIRHFNFAIFSRVTRLRCNTAKSPFSEGIERSFRA